MKVIQLELPQEHSPVETTPTGALARDQAGDHLRSLYAIAKTLTGFTRIEQSLPAVLGMVRRTLPIRTAVLVLTGLGRRTIVWKDQSVSAEHLRRAKRHAQKTHGYLVGSARRPDDDDAPLPEDSPASSTSAEGTFLVLPIALSTRPTFGTLLVECATRPDELDLTFVNAVANQLAVALDRDDGIRAQQATAEARRVAAEEQKAAAEAREGKQRILAEAGAFLAATLEPAPLQAVARLAVPLLGDACLIDVLLDDGTVGRSAAFSDPDRYGTAVDLDILSHGATVADAPEDPRFGAIVRGAGLASSLVIPLRARGNDLGSMAFFSSQPGRYGPSDVAFAQEVALRVAMALDNRRLYEQARAAVLARENLLAIVSHDLKNPLSVIFMVLAYLAREPNSGEPGLQTGRAVEIIQRAATRMKSLVGDILDSASMSAGHFTIQMDDVDAASLLTEAVENATPLAAKKSLSIQSDVYGPLPIVRVDAQRIQQVFANLLGNAIKFTPERGRITLRARAFASAVVFSVVDDGPGISEGDRDHLFDRFWQAPATASQGTGLGLFIARSIVESHGGRIWVESEAGAGSTFSFQVPLAARHSGVSLRVHAA